MIAYHATNYDPPFRNQLVALSAQLGHSGWSLADARIQAFGRVYRNVLAQSQTLTYVDTFMLLAVAAAVMFALSFLVRKNNVGGGPVVME